MVWSNLLSRSANPSLSYYQDSEIHVTSDPRKLIYRCCRQGTWKRSALRITREAELLGAALESHHSRENLVIGAKFLREDLPYFVELLGEVISQTKYMRRQSDNASYVDQMLIADFSLRIP